MVMPVMVVVVMMVREMVMMPSIIDGGVLVAAVGRKH